MNEWKTCAQLPSKGCTLDSVALTGQMPKSLSSAVNRNPAEQYMLTQMYDLYPTLVVGMKSGCTLTGIADVIAAWLQAYANNPSLKKMLSRAMVMSVCYLRSFDCARSCKCCQAALNIGTAAGGFMESIGRNPRLFSTFTEILYKYTVIEGALCGRPPLLIPLLPDVLTMVSWNVFVFQYQFTSAGHGVPITATLNGSPVTVTPSTIGSETQLYTVGACVKDGDALRVQYHVPNTCLGLSPEIDDAFFELVYGETDLFVPTIEPTPAQLTVTSGFYAGAASNISAAIGTTPVPLSAPTYTAMGPVVYTYPGTAPAVGQVLTVTFTDGQPSACGTVTQTATVVAA